MTLKLTIISDRINPGFKSTKTLLDAGDCPGPDWPDQQRILACEAETGHQEDTFFGLPGSTWNG